MHNIDQPASPLDLSRGTPAYYQLIHDLTARLPKPLDDTPEALYARNQAAIEKVATLLPVNANEADLAALSVATRAQADDIMRLLRVNTGDITVIMKLNAQYVSMVRTSLSTNGLLMRMQALRHKREAITAARDADEWAQHIAASSMRQVLDAGPLPGIPAAEHAPPAPAAEEPPAQAAAPVAHRPAPVLTEVPPPPTAAPPAPPRPRLVAVAAEAQAEAPAEAHVQASDLLAEADHYALVYPDRASEIRHHRGLPPDCSYGPPEDDLLHAIVIGTTPTLRALDALNAAMA